MSLINLSKFILPEFISCIDDNSYYFKQISISNSFPLEYTNITNKNIEGSISSMKIYEAKISDYVLNNERITFCIDDKVLIISGEVIVKTFISYPEQCSKICSIKNVLPFKTFMKVPKDINEDTPINLKYIIEDTVSEIIPEDKIFICISLVIQYLDHYLLPNTMPLI